MVAVAAAAILLAAAAGCNGKSPSSTPSTTAAQSQQATSTTSAPTKSTAAPTTTVRLVNADPGKFNRKDFGSPFGDTNRWLPLQPGYQSVRDGTLFRGRRELHHRRRFTVTDAVKVINGVRAVLVLDQDIDAGQIAEQALDYFAQDKHGNVWYMGSYTETYEGGQFVNAVDAWLAGVNGATAGVAMMANPRKGMPGYVQASIPGRETIHAEVAKLGEKKCVPFRCFSNTLAILEDGTEFKWYAEGVGGIATEPNYSGGEQEKERLLNVIQLTPKGLAEFSALAIRLDRHARTTAVRVFGRSALAKRSPA
jgi:guanyl-specific ribonuclease Sa